MRHHLPREQGAGEPLTEIWTGRATNRMQWLLALGGAACMALGIQLAVSVPTNSRITFAALVMAVVGCIGAGLLMLFGTVAFVHVAVRLNAEYLEVRCGHMGLPRRRIPLAHVVSVDFAPHVSPRHWGGWGCRWRPEKGTAWVVRRGEGLVLELGDGRKFTVTVDDAESAVAAIRGLLRPRSGPTTAGT